MPTELLQPVVRIPVPGHGVHILPLQRVLDDELVDLLDLVAGCEGPRKTKSEFNIHPESFTKSVMTFVIFTTIVLVLFIGDPTATSASRWQHFEWQENNLSYLK